MGKATATPFLLVLVLGGACDPEPLFEDPDADDRFKFEAATYTLFGRPILDAGVEERCCMPRCTYIEDGETKIWTAPLYTKEDMQSLYSDWELIKPVFEDDQFNPPLEPQNSGVEWVCAVLPRPELQDGGEDPMPYELINCLETIPDPKCDRAMVTHRGRCGACSSLQNLAIYIANNDLTAPLRDCGVAGLFDSKLSRLACIASLGFDLPCARVWDDNAQDTQGKCLTNCTSGGKHNVDYECGPGVLVPTDLNLLNDCLKCDEVFSADAFRAGAGRSRRNSGLPSAICRRCDGVFRIEHYYSLPNP